MCLLGVSMINNHIYGSKVPQNPHFGGMNRHFKPNMQKIQIASLYLQICVSDWHEIWQAAATSNRLRGWSRMVVRQFQDGGRPPFWKSIYRHISVKSHLIFMKFCTEQQILNWVNVAWSKIKKLHWTDCEFDRTYFLFHYIFCFFFTVLVVHPHHDHPVTTVLTHYSPMAWYSFIASFIRSFIHHSWQFV